MFGRATASNYLDLTKFSCDLWEEFSSDDFYWNRMAYVYSLNTAGRIIMMMTMIMVMIMMMMIMVNRMAYVYSLNTAADFADSVGQSGSDWRLLASEIAEETRPHFDGECIYFLVFICHSFHWSIVQASTSSRRTAGRRTGR